MNTKNLFSKFSEWLRERYPNLRLLRWQATVADMFLSRRGTTSRILLLRLLAEFSAQVEPVIEHRQVATYQLLEIADLLVHEEAAMEPERLSELSPAHRQLYLKAKLALKAALLGGLPPQSITSHTLNIVNTFDAPPDESEYIT